jgi:hypothetical protein
MNGVVYDLNQDHGHKLLNQYIYAGWTKITTARLGLSFGAGMGQFDQEKINRVVDDFPRLLNTVIAARGGHFE